jgi:cell wall-associated NlpC family hydrolase
MPTREGIIQTAVNELKNKTRYIHQGQQLGSHLDCVGLIYAVFKKNGYEFEYDNTLVEARDRSIINALDVTLKRTDSPLSGDIVSFEKNGEVFHVGLYLSSRNLGTFIHTQSISNCVTLDNFEESNYWRRFFYAYHSIEPLLTNDN